MTVTRQWRRDLLHGHFHVRSLSPRRGFRGVPSGRAQAEPQTTARARSSRRSTRVDCGMSDRRRPDPQLVGTRKPIATGALVRTVPTGTFPERVCRGDARRRILRARIALVFAGGRQEYPRRRASHRTWRRGWRSSPRASARGNEVTHETTLRGGSHQGLFERDAAASGPTRQAPRRRLRRRRPALRPACSDLLADLRPVR